MSTDPLVALRHAIRSKTPITYTSPTGDPTPALSTATHIVLSPSPSHSFPKSTRTRFRKSSSGEAFFTLDAVVLAWLFKDAPSAEYMRQARENGLMGGFVGVTERKGLVDWLEGRVGVHERIVPLEDAASTTPPGSPPRGAHRALHAVSEPTASPAKRRYVADTHDVEVVKKIKANEVELRDRNSVLRGVKPNNFSAIREVYAMKLKEIKDKSKPGAVTQSAPSTPDPKLQARKAKNMYPIIMISSSPTALITMHNAKRFLQEAVFEPSTSARARATSEGNTKPEDMLPIYRRRTAIDPSGREHETSARYFVVDGVEALSKFGPDAWERVVCVMTTGQAWQFRPYRWSDPRQLFHHVKGIYFSWTNDPPNPKIKDWNVTELKIDPHRRHVDKSVVAHFWKTLDGWILANKPWLMQG